MTERSQVFVPDVVWDFDGTLLPFDSEQALLKRLSLSPRTKLGWLRAIWGRILAWGDRTGLLGDRFKTLYMGCLRGLSTIDLDEAAAHLARRISSEDRVAVRRIAACSRRMVIISCGTGDLIERVLAAAKLADCFQAVEANWFTFWMGRVEGMDLGVHLAADKVAAAARLGVVWPRTVAIGDGLTDVPVLDAARWPILLDRSGDKAALVVRKSYQGARSLTQIARFFDRRFGSQAEG